MRFFCFARRVAHVPRLRRVVVAGAAVAAVAAGTPALGASGPATPRAASAARPASAHRTDTRARPAARRLPVPSTGTLRGQGLLVGVRPLVTPQFNGSVYALAFRGTTVYVGGSFTRATSGGRTYARQRLAAFDAGTGALLSWAPTADATVRALAVDGTTVYAAGDFGTISGLHRDNLAALDVVSGAPGTFAHRISGAPYALAVGHGRLYLAGSVRAVDGLPRADLAAFSLTTGVLDAGWRPVADNAVRTIVAATDRVYVGGAFHQINGVGALRIAALSTTGALVTTFRPAVAPADVNAIAVDTSGVYAATAGQGGRAVAYTDTGEIIWQRIFDGDAAAITTLDGVVYIGGHFDTACLTARNGPHGLCLDGSVPRVKLAAVTSAGDLTAWAPQANGIVGVRALAADAGSGTIAAGGDFTLMNGQSRLRVAGFR
ncbi:hypothetical protein [Krasilnikovia sp. MM14-A1259]|uniref:hypothetical protein n=1 Tax=Krasilnikovia sp. MM14-A1259 TaxID=3373539 RepID=UPI0037FFA769